MKWIIILPYQNSKMLYTNNFENLEKNNDNSIILAYVIVSTLTERRVFESLFFNLRYSNKLIVSTSVE